MLLKLAWRNIWRNKRRTFITFFAVAFAVFIAVATWSMKKGIYNKMIKDLTSFSTGYCQVHANGYWAEQSLDNSMPFGPEVQALEAREDVTVIIPRIYGGALASSGELSKPTLVMGMDAEKEKQIKDLSQWLVWGDMPQAGEPGIVVGSKLAKHFGMDDLESGAPGQCKGKCDSLILLGQGYHGQSAAGLFPVRGVIKMPMDQMNRSLVILPIDLAQQFFAMDGRITNLIVQPKVPAKLDQMKTEIRATLGEEYEVMDWLEMSPETIQTIQADSVEGYVIMGILYMIISFGLMGTMLMMVAERRHEFGVLVGIGMRKIRLIKMVILESIFISVNGALCGFIISVPMVVYMYYHPIRLGGQMAETMEKFGMEGLLEFSADPMIFIQQVLIVLGLALLVGLYPISYIRRLKPVEAIHS